MRRDAPGHTLVDADNDSNEFVNRFRLDAEKQGIQGSNDLTEGREMLARQEGDWRSFQRVLPGYGLQPKDQAVNPLIRENIRKYNIRHGNYCVSIGEIQPDIRTEDTPHFRKLVSKRDVMLKLLMEDYHKANTEMLLEKEGHGNVALPQPEFHETAYPSSSGSVMVPVHREGTPYQNNVLNEFLPVTDRGMHVDRFRSPYDRQPDFLKRFSGR